METLILRPGHRDGTFLNSEGTVFPIPPGWELVPPGDAALTRRIKAAGLHWVIQEKRGRKTFSKGVCTDSKTVGQIRSVLEIERSSDSHKRRQESAVRSRQLIQSVYVRDFAGAVREFLGFHPKYEFLASQLAELVSRHATPVGSGTVARTQRISIERRAEAATIAWMRHQTTVYDSMKIPQVKGKRREIRRGLADHSRKLLDRYRRGEPFKTDCPLIKAVAEFV